MQQFKIESDFNSIEKWLNEYLALIQEDEIITPHDQPLADSPHDLNKKGVIFWFMRSEGYKELSKIIEINAIEQKYQLEINGVNYDLVYFDSALEGEEFGSCYSKLDFHFNQSHNSELICKGALSTLRAGLGSVLSDDLRKPDTESAVNDFMNKYMKVLWLEVENKNFITISDKIKFIKEIRPLFNIKHNPNATTTHNCSKKYKIRRAKVYIETRRSLHCPSEIINENNKHRPNNQTPSFNHQSHGVTHHRDNNSKVTEFFSLKGQRIDQVIRGIKSIGCGRALIEIFIDGQRLYLFNNNGVSIVNRDNRPNAQNAYSYLANSCYSSGPPEFDILHEGQATRRFALIDSYLNFVRPNEQDTEIIIKVTSH